MLNRRAFLGLAASATAGALASAAFDPERLLWVPGQRTLFLPPERTLVQAKTLQEALSKGLTAVFPGGDRLQVRLGPGAVYWGRFPVRMHPPAPTLAEMIQFEVAAVEEQGGRVLKIEDLQPGWNW
jgi:hypothetical protein